MSVSRVPFNFLDHEDEVQEFPCLDWQLPSSSQVVQQINSAFKWNDADYDGKFIQMVADDLAQEKIRVAKLEKEEAEKAQKAQQSSQQQPSSQGQQQQQR